MFKEFRKGLRRVKDATRSQSCTSTPSPTPAPAPTQPPIVDPAIHAAAPQTTAASSDPVAISSVVVSPYPGPHNDTQNLGPTLIIPTSSAGGRSTMHTSWAGFKTLLDALKECSDAFGPLKAAIYGLSQCIEIFEQEAKVHEKYTSLRSELDALFKDIAGYLSNPALSIMPPIVENIAKSIEHEAGIIIQKEQRNAMERYAEVEEDEDQILECYRRIQSLLGRLTLNVNMNIWMSIGEQTTALRLGKLPKAPTAMYRSTASDSLRRVGCTPNTRVDVIEQLLSWARDSTSEKVYWLNGMAGTGKTTIAYTLCDHLQRARQLGASFFCSRQLPECRDVNRIVPSISYQLSQFSVPFRHALSEVLERNSDIYNQPLQDQVEQLVVAPLRKVAHTFTADVIIVVDALDECEDKDGVDRILGVLLSYVAYLDVKFFVTSRPEPKIVDQMRNREDGDRRSELRLHELDRMTVQRDITTYLKDRLRRAKVADAQIGELAQRSGVLFIYAATVVRYIEYDNFSRCSQRLNTVLGASSSAPNGSDKDVNLLYATILKAAFDDPALEDSERAEMRDMLCHVVCAREPLSVGTMANLLGLDDADTVQAALRPLLSVLNVSEPSRLVTTLHESFPNYILNKKRSGDFHCDARQHHARMARICFDLIKVPSPPFNICGLESSYVFDDAVPDIDERVEKAISKGLVYACRYWGAHLELADVAKGLFEALYEFLSTRLLLWMEVLNLKKQMHEGAVTLHNMLEWCEAEGCPNELQALVQDAYRFAAVVSSSLILHSTPHIYVSALAFWPKSRPVSKYYLPKMSGLMNSTGTAMARRELTPVTITIHDKVLCVSYSPDGRHLASGHTDGSIWIWDARTGRSVGQLLNGHTDWITLVAYSPDSTRIVSSSHCSIVRIWDSHTHQPVGELPYGHQDNILSVSCSNDDVYIVGSSYNGVTMCVWNSHTGSSLKIDAESYQLSAANSPNGAYLVSGSSDGCIHIWDARTGQPVGEPAKGHSGSVISLAYSPDGSHIVSGSEDTTVCIWDAHTGQNIGQPLKGHTGGILSVRYSPSGLHIVSGSQDNTVRIWDARSRQMIGQPFDRHTGPVLSVSYSPDGRHIVSGSEDGTIRIWDANVGEMAVGTHRQDDAQLVSSSNNKTVVVKDACAGQMVGQLFEGHDGSVDPVSFSPDGVYVVSGSSNTSVCIWDTRTGKMVGQPLVGHTEMVRSACFSPDGAHIASGSYDETIRIWDMRTGKAVGRPLRGHTGGVYSVSYSPDGAYIVSGSGDHTIRIWDAHTGKMVGQPLEGHTDSVFSVSFSFNSARIVSGSGDNTLRIWDARTGDMIGEPYEGHTNSVVSVSWSPNSAYVASGSVDKTVRIWDACTGKTIGQPLEGHAEMIQSVSYSSDGAYIVSSSYDGTIRIWDSRTGRTVGHPFGWLGRMVSSATLSRDGTRLVAGYSNGSIRIWHIHTRQVTSTWTASLGFQPQAVAPCHCNVCTSSADWDIWELKEDGWIVNERSELLIWIPPDLRPSLIYPHNTVMISRHGTLQLDFGSAKLGKSWQCCYLG